MMLSKHFSSLRGKLVNSSARNYIESSLLQRNSLGSKLQSVPPKRLLQRHTHSCCRNSSKLCWQEGNGFRKSELPPASCSRAQTLAQARESGRAAVGQPSLVMCLGW